MKILRTVGLVSPLLLTLLLGAALLRGGSMRVERRGSAPTSREDRVRPAGIASEVCLTSPSSACEKEPARAELRPVDRWRTVGLVLETDFDDAVAALQSPASDRETRLLAIWALGKFRNGTSWALLRSLLFEPESHIRLQVVQALVGWEDAFVAAEMDRVQREDPSSEIRIAAGHLLTAFQR